MASILNPLMNTIEVRKRFKPVKDSGDGVSFMEKCISGTIKPDKTTLNTYICAFFDYRDHYLNKTEFSLEDAVSEKDYLGMTDGEYKVWLYEPNKLEQLLELRTTN